MLDLVVIGAGLSGLMAAYTAAQSGLTVRVINKGLGSMHWGAGTVDVLGYAPDAPEKPVQHPFTALANLVVQYPDHPYGLLSSDEIRAGLASFVALTEEIGLPYRGSAESDQNLFLPSPAGAARPVYLAPEAQVAGDLSRSEPMLIVGFKGMRDFFPDLIAQNLAKQGHQARSAFLPLNLVTDRIDANTVHLAEALDDLERRTRLGHELKKLVKIGERIGLPAILGMNDHSVVIADLERLSGVPVFEIPTLPPSVPGIRLYKALRSRLLELGVRIEAGMEVVSAEMTARHNGTPGSIQSVISATSARPYKHRAHNYLLATGGILGGGFNSDHTGHVWETIFDLPLTVPQDRSMWFASGFLSPTGHPIFHGGVVVNDVFQPVDGGKLIFSNLWVAGNILANADPILERSLEGSAIVTGIAAGKAIANL
ncbi:MAG: glycerol-3-phosphate dehydrogenase subunit GlpB [Anaerolineae bacterium]|nr:glycerol-3-phosphate dehydrogenase subunit GlpB [Anaerolineae bacterium]MCO5195668.1 glycerol-3-phosphate dehydrogenase subunit GlpB [Anaerolineae bacterium]MCO5205105.1 glycerol-3-phosphate dehydrogenase subunit GlpB [Anaerolineae bacterium]